MEKGIFRGNMRELFGGIPPSHGARKLVQEAFGLGLDPSEITRQAGAAARAERRTKVGIFGQSAEVLHSLSDMIENAKMSNFRKKT